MAHVQFLVEVNVPKMPSNSEYEALQQIVTYIIQEALPLDIIGQFVFALNWNEKTLSIGEIAAQSMFNEQAKHLRQKPELPQATDKSELHQAVESFIRSVSGNPYYEESEESQLIDDLHQTGKSIKIQMDLLADKQEKMINKSAEVAARRLSLLWQVREFIMDSGSSDDEKWDSISGLLDDHPLLITTEEDELALAKEEIT